MAQKRKSGFHISYVTIAYRSVFLGMLALLPFAALASSLAYPEAADRAMASGEAGVVKVLAKVALGNAPARIVEAGPQQAHFTNIASDSSAQVMNHPCNDQRAILLKTSFGEVALGDEKGKAATMGELSFTANAETGVKTKEIARPVLISPATRQVANEPAEESFGFSGSSVKSVGGTMSIGLLVGLDVFDRTQPLPSGQRDYC